MGTTIESDWENTRLLEELAAARAEIERLQAESDPEALHIAYLHGQADRNQKLAAEQAKNVRLREALQFLIATKELKESVGKTPEYEQMRIIAWVKATVALSSPSDTSALEAIVKKAGEKMRENCITAAGPEDSYQDDWIRAKVDACDAIRDLPAVTLEDLK